MNKLGFALVFMAFVCGPLFPLPHPSEDKSPTCDYSEIYRQDGWAMPGIDKAQVLGHRGSFPNISGVFVTSLTPGEQQSMLTYYVCSRDHPGRLEIEEIPIGILHLARYDFGGHVFAYYVHFGRERFENGERVDFGTESWRFFYDLDGSGRFTLMRESRLPGVPDFVPDWAKKDGAISQVK